MSLGKLGLLPERERRGGQKEREETLDSMCICSPAVDKGDSLGPAFLP